MAGLLLFTIGRSPILQHFPEIQGNIFNACFRIASSTDRLLPFSSRLNPPRLNDRDRAGTCRSQCTWLLPVCRRTGHSRPVNRNSVTSHRLSFPGAVILLRLTFNARRDSLRHCIPPGFSLVVPCVFHCCFHFSPRYGILPL